MLNKQPRGPEYSTVYQSKESATVCFMITEVPCMYVSEVLLPQSPVNFLFRHTILRFRNVSRAMKGG